MYRLDVMPHACDGALPARPALAAPPVEEVDMAMQAPTRITIEVHPPEPGMDWQQPVVRVVPEVTPASSEQPAAAAGQPVVAAAPRESIPGPAAYEPGPCRCLDDEDCGADHANE